jgi:polysaccharide deacetylase
MPYVVTLNPGLVDVVLPNNGRYQGGDVVTLSDEDYSVISSTVRAALFASVVPSGVSSVNGQTGDVSLVAGVSSVNGRSGAVTVVPADLSIPDVSALYPPAARTPRFVPPSSVITTMQSGHGWTSSGTGATFNLNDTTDFISGTQAAKLTTAGTGAQTNIRKFAGTVPDTTAKMFRIRIKVDDVTHLNELDFYLGSSSLANNYKWSFFIAGGSAWITSGDWVTVTLSFADATTAGTVTRNNMTDLQLQAWDDNTGNPVTVHFQSVELIPDGSAVFANGVASICFDDSWSSPQSVGAFSKLDGLGLAATLFTITDQLGSANHLTLADLKTRVDRWGWESAAHSYTDVSHTATYTGLSAAALETDIRAQRAWLLANGIRSTDGTAYPLGQFGKTTDNQPTQDLVRRYFSWARTTANRTRETFPPANPFRLRAISSISTFTGGTTPTSLTTTNGVIEKTATFKSWLILVFHKITSGAAGSTTECQKSDFDSIVDKLISSGVTVLPIGDVLRYYG